MISRIEQPQLFPAAHICNHNMMKLICFDLDDTLWDFESCLQRAETELHAWLDTHYPDFAASHSIDSLRARRRTLLEERAELQHDIGRVRWLAMKHAAEHSGYDSEAAKRLANAAFRKFMVHRNDVEIYADVMPTLTRLRDEYLLCSLTNGNADLVRIGIHHVFHHNLSAEQVGAAKPSPAIFREACRLAGVHPSQAVHVGDDPDNDVFAARAAGMKCIWMNRHAAEWPHAERADAEIRTLDELEHRLRQLIPVAV